MARKEAGVVIRYEYLRETSADMHKPSKKRKQVASDIQEFVHKPSKKGCAIERIFRKKLKKLLNSLFLCPLRQEIKEFLIRYLILLSHLMHL